MVSFVYNYGVPRFCLLSKLSAAIAATHKVARYNYKWLFVPIGAGYWLLQRSVASRRFGPQHFVAIVNGPVQVKFFTQLHLPLAADSAGARIKTR